MSVNSFVERWTSKERECGLGAASAQMIPIADTFLPDAAAPFLSFSAAANPSSILDCFGAPTDWTDEDRERLQPFLVIGSDGAGNPICLESLGAVVLLDHEDGFRTAQFVNSSIPQLCECLLAYFCEDDADRFRAVVSLVDTQALQRGSFWWHEATGLVGVA